MALFTFLMEYRGGTYVSQVEADSYLEAPAKWAKKEDWSYIPKAGKKFKKQLLAELESDPVAALDGLTNAWCTATTIKGKLALITFVQTAE